MSTQIRVSDHTIPRGDELMTLRVYRPAAETGAGIIWAHGGGFFADGIDDPEADWVPRELALRGLSVVSVNYRLAPVSESRAAFFDIEPRAGVRAPIPAEDVLAGFEWARSTRLTAGRWALGGASAGGNLVAAATLRMIADGAPPPALVVLIYPTLHVEQAPLDDSLQRTLIAEGWRPDGLRIMYDNYLGDAPPDRFSVPGEASVDELSGFPQTLIVNSEIDALRVSGEAFARALATAGVGVEVRTEPDTRHGHLSRPNDPGALATLDLMAQWILAAPARSSAG